MKDFILILSKKNNTDVTQNLPGYHKKLQKKKIELRNLQWIISLHPCSFVPL